MDTVDPAGMNDAYKYHDYDSTNNQNDYKNKLYEMYDVGDIVQVHPSTKWKVNYPEGKVYITSIARITNKILVNQNINIKFLNPHKDCIKIGLIMGVDLLNVSLIIKKKDLGSLTKDAAILSYIALNNLKKADNYGSSISGSSGSSVSGKLGN